MTAVLIPTRNEAEWLQARSQGITASEIAVLMGLSPYDSPYALYHRKRGDLPGVEENDAMLLGTYMESFVADRFADRRPEFTVTGNGEALFAHPDRPWQMATPDRLVTEDSYSAWDAIAVLECKIDGGSDGWGDDGTDEIPVHYRCQVLWQMDVLGVSTGFVACLLWNRRKVRVYELTLDDQALADLELMRTEAVSFLARIERQDPPDVDWRPATRHALKHLHPGVEDRDVVISSTLAGKYRAACWAVKRAEQRKQLAENLIRSRLGSGRRAVRRDGETIVRRDVYDVAAKTIERKAYTVDKLVAVKPRESTP